MTCRHRRNKFRARNFQRHKNFSTMSLHWECFPFWTRRNDDAWYTVARGNGKSCLSHEQWRCNSTHISPRRSTHTRNSTGGRIKISRPPWKNHEYVDAVQTQVRFPQPDIRVAVINSRLWRSREEPGNASGRRAGGARNSRGFSSRG